MGEEAIVVPAGASPAVLEGVYWLLVLFRISPVSDSSASMILFDSGSVDKRFGVWVLGGTTLSLLIGFSQGSV